jgi:cell division protein FtsA
MSRDVLCRIIEMRLDETLGLVKAELEQKQLLDKLGAGVFLTGGVARTRGLQQMAERIFGTTETVGAPGTVSGVRTVLESPELSTAVGLVRYGALCNASKPKRAGLFGQLISRIGTWVRPAEGHSYDYGTQQTGGR